MALTAVRKGSLVDFVARQLRARIESGAWRVDSRIPVEGALCARLGVGRNTVREAVRVLVHAGMLETRQGDGTYVRARSDAAETLHRIGHARLRDLIEVRLMMEVEAARLAAMRRTRTDLTALARALDARARAGAHTRDRIEQDTRFHHAVVSAAHNRALEHLYDYFADAILRTIVRTETDAGRPRPSHAEHARLLAAIEAGDGSAAADTARQLLSPYLAALPAKRQD